jgi:tRNA threonylcarbamoyladenosine biosynthesis protein TsaE
MELIYKLAEIDKTAKEFLLSTTGYNVIALHGEMGAGKTTFIHAVCEAMGIKDTIGSPTFSIINEYATTGGQAVYHIDLYRIKDEAEAINAGVEDCLYSGRLCYVEWPEKAPGLFPDNTLHISLTVVDTNTRKLQINL